MFIAGKAILKNGATSAEVVGYVVNEDMATVSIRIDSNEEAGQDILKKIRPKYNKKEGAFHYDDGPFDTYKWVKYHPIRFKIHKSGQVYFTANIIKLNLHDDTIIQL